MRINENKLEEASRNLGVIFISSGAVGFFFEYSTAGSIFASLLGLLFILFGVKEGNNGD